MTNNKPNIIWICTEHQRFDTINKLNNPHINTPNLNKLIDEGVVFTRAYSQSTVCTPSRSCFLTGRYPVTTRCRQNGQNIPQEEILITRELKDRGYSCGLFGKLHISAAASGTERRIDDGYDVFKWSHGATAKHGGEWIKFLAENGKTFDEVYKESDVLLSREVGDYKLHQTTWCFDQAIDFINNSDGPFCASINPFAAHDPFDYLPEFYKNYNPEEMPDPCYQPEELDRNPYPQRYRHEQKHQYYGDFESKSYDNHTAKQRREMKAAYYATIEHIDFEVGKLLEYLEKTNQRENTLILFHADHGELLGDHGLYRKGSFFYEPSVRIPFIASMPSLFPQNKQIDDLVGLIDIVPTIYEILGEKIPKRVQGKSLMPLIRGDKNYKHRKGVYSEYYNANPKFPGHTGIYATMWREEDYKIIIHHGADLGELYDLVNDPCEMINLWNDSAYFNKKMELMKECFDASVFTMDPVPERTESF